MKHSKPGGPMPQHKQMATGSMPGYRSGGAVKHQSKAPGFKKYPMGKGCK